MDMEVTISSREYGRLARIEFLHEFFRSLLLEGADLPKDIALRLVEIDA